MPDVQCPKCKKLVLGVSRHWGTSRSLVSMEIHHVEDAERAAAGAATRVCKIKMTFGDSKVLMEAVAGDLGKGNRK